MTEPLTVKDPPCPVRLGRGTDVSYLLETWVQHLRQQPGRTVRFWKKWVLRVLADPAMTIRVAHDPEDEDAILGFAVLELPFGPIPPCVHFIYVRDKARRCGVASDILHDFAHLDTVEYTGRPAFTIPVPPSFRPNAMRTPTEDGIYV